MPGDFRSLSKKWGRGLLRPPSPRRRETKEHNEITSSRRRMRPSWLLAGMMLMVTCSSPAPTGTTTLEHDTTFPEEDTQGTDPLPADSSGLEDSVTACRYRIITDWDYETGELTSVKCVTNPAEDPCLQCDEGSGLCTPLPAHAPCHTANAPCVLCDPLASGFPGVHGTKSPRNAAVTRRHDLVTACDAQPLNVRPAGHNDCLETRIESEDPIRFGPPFGTGSKKLARLMLLPRVVVPAWRQPNENVP